MKCATRLLSMIGLMMLVLGSAAKMGSAETVDSTSSAPEPASPEGPVGNPEAPAGTAEVVPPSPGPTQQEKTILSTILKSFKNGHVDLKTLASALNDPNVNRLASSLSNANLNKLASVLEEPHVDLSKLVSALSDPDLNLDKLVATFGDPQVLSAPSPLKPSRDESGIMAMMKSWANQIGDSLKGHLTNTSPTPATGMVDKKKTGEKHDVGLDKAPNEAQKSSDGIPEGFERSTPSPDANTYGKSLMTGVEVTTGTKTTDIYHTEVEGESQSAGFNHKLIYYAVAGVLAISMCIFLATRLSKSYRGEEVEETRSSIRMVA